MNEITVVVKQDPGRVTWNFEEVKNFLAAEMDRYKGLVYTDDTIKTAKSDVAYLRSLSKQVEERRKEVKAKCLEPYDTIEKQAKELVRLIEDPISEITKQVSEYEERRKERLKQEISAYWKEAIKNIPAALRAKAWEGTYDHRWLNATFPKKDWKAAIDATVERISSDLKAIESFESEFEKEMLEAYGWGLRLCDATGRMNALNEQKQKILERERRRKEEEERAERERAEEAARKAEEAVRASQMEEPSPEPEKGNTEAIKAPKPQESVQIPPKNAQKPQEVARREAEMPSMTLRIHGKTEVLEKIKAYIRFTGATFEEVE